MIIRYFASNL